VIIIAVEFGAQLLAFLSHFDDLTNITSIKVAPGVLKFCKRFDTTGVITLDTRMEEVENGNHTSN